MNTRNKIKVMKASVDGKKIQCKTRGNEARGWSLICEPIGWNWESIDYRIKPQTVEDAANAAVNRWNFWNFHAVPPSTHELFIAGAKWQKEQDIDDYIKNEEENDQYKRDCNE